jgi:hypothetical protein
LTGGLGGNGSVEGGGWLTEGGSWVAEGCGDAADAGAGTASIAVVSTRKRAAVSTDLGIETSRRSAPATAQGYGRQQG